MLGLEDIMLGGESELEAYGPVAVKRVASTGDRGIIVMLIVVSRLSGCPLVHNGKHWCSYNFLGRCMMREMQRHLSAKIRPWLRTALGTTLTPPFLVSFTLHRVLMSEAVESISEVRRLVS